VHEHRGDLCGLAPWRAQEFPAGGLGAKELAHRQHRPWRRGPRALVYYRTIAQADAGTDVVAGDARQ
jgi:hypothetical protein